MFVLSEWLTTGQVTFILRVVVQILSYGGLFLIALIILGNTPRVAPLETHDTLNRMVGKSTATLTTIRWIKRRIFSKSRDPSPSLHLLISFILSLSYGLFVALSDVGFIGLQACSVPFPSYTAFPASVRSEADASALIRKNLIQGTSPANVSLFRCNSVEVVPLNANQTVNSCTSWSNSTYDNPAMFRSLNLTDTDVLMFRNLGPDLAINNGRKELQVYYFGAMGSTETKAKVNSGIAVIPHNSGARMIVGAPDLKRNQTVNIPKTMVVDLSVGCLPLGLVGIEEPAIIGWDPKSDYFMPDPKYMSILRSHYIGPDYLFGSLSSMANEIRQLVLPQYNTSAVLANGYIKRVNSTSGPYTWTTEVGNWDPYVADINSTKHNDILQACGERVHRSIGVTVPPKNKTRSDACTTVTLSGSFSRDRQIFRRYEVMACASATSIKMASAILNMNQNEILTANILDIPSDLHEIKAGFWEAQYNKTTNDTIFYTYGSVQRFTLSDNPAGQKDHFILQTGIYVGASTETLSRGAASVGSTIPQIGVASIRASAMTNSATENIINGTFFSCENYTSSMVTTWAGEHAASFFLSSYTMNGFAALDKEPLKVQSTGGKRAVCYQAQYFAAFVPLLLAALLIVIWVAFMLAASKIRGSKVWEARYGGLAPTIVSPALIKQSPDEILAWEDVGEAPHLRPIHSATSTPNIPSMPNETTILMTSQTDKEY